MKKYSQLDSRWANDKLGHTTYTVAKYGCTTTSICMLHTRFYKGHYFPSEAAKTFKYTDQGLLYWSSDFPGMEFVGRYDGAPDKGILKEYMTKKKGIIIEVNGGAHWVVGYYNGFWGLTIYDPIDSKRKRLSSSYTATGYALFCKST